MCVFIRFLTGVKCALFRSFQSIRVAFYYSYRQQTKKQRQVQNETPKKSALDHREKSHKIAHTKNTYYNILLPEINSKIF